MFGQCHRFKVCTGARYIGIFVEDNESKRYWMKERTETPEQKIHTIRETVGKYSRKNHATLVRAIQSEWIFL